jgi:hypothetical protein
MTAVNILIQKKKRNNFPNLYNANIRQHYYTYILFFISALV